MDISNAIVILLSMISLMCSIFASYAMKMALKMKAKATAKAKAREMSRVKVPIEEIAIQMNALPKEHGEAVFTVKAKRVLQVAPSEENGWLVG